MAPIFTGSKFGFGRSAADTGPLPYFIFDSSQVTVIRDTGNTANNGTTADLFDNDINTGISIGSNNQSELNLDIVFNTPIPVNNGSFRVYWVPQDNCGGTGRCGQHAINSGSFTNNNTFSNGFFLWDTFSTSTLSRFQIKMTSNNPGSWGNSLAIRSIEVDGVDLAFGDKIYTDGRNPSPEH